MTEQTQSLSVSLTGLTLHVKDVDKSLEFYRQLPGVQVQVHRPGDFALLRMGEMRLGLLQHGTQAFHVELETEDLDKLYEHLKTTSIEVGAPPSVKNWGERDFLITDPDGNTLEFGAFDDHPADNWQRNQSGNWPKP